MKLRFFASIITFVFISYSNTVVFSLLDTNQDPNTLIYDAVVEAKYKQLKFLEKKINKVIKRLNELGYHLKETPLLSPTDAHRKLQEIERIIKRNLSPQFRQTTVSKHRYYDDIEGLHAEEELEGKEAANNYIKNSGGSFEELETEDPKEFLKAVESLAQQIADQVASTATGIDDYTGYQALRERERAKAEADLALSMGLDITTAADISGSSTNDVEKYAKVAEENEKKVESKPEDEET